MSINMQLLFHLYCNKIPNGVGILEKSFKFERWCSKPGKSKDVLICLEIRKKFKNFAVECNIIVFSIGQPVAFVHPCEKYF